MTKVVEEKDLKKVTGGAMKDCAAPGSPANRPMPDKPSNDTVDDDDTRQDPFQG